MQQTICGGRYRAAQRGNRPSDTKNNKKKKNAEPQTDAALRGRFPRIFRAGPNWSRFAQAAPSPALWHSPGQFNLRIEGHICPIL
jgi:hypothetical protein